MQKLFIFYIYSMAFIKNIGALEGKSPQGFSSA